MAASPQLVCAGCGNRTTIYKPMCDDCLRAVGETPITCILCLSGHYPDVRHGLHYNSGGGYVGKCSDCSTNDAAANGYPKPYVTAATREHAVPLHLFCEACSTRDAGAEPT